MTTTENTSIKPAVFTLTGKTAYSSDDYEVLVGFVKDGELPQYVVRNRATEVIEFNNEVLSFVLEWMKHFQERLNAIRSGKDEASEDVVQTPRTAFNA